MKSLVHPTMWDETVKPVFFQKSLKFSIAILCLVAVIFLVGNSMAYGTVVTHCETTAPWITGGGTLSANPGEAQEGTNCMEFVSSGSGYMSYNTYYDWSGANYAIFYAKTDSTTDPTVTFYLTDNSGGDTLGWNFTVPNSWETIAINLSMVPWVISGSEANFDNTNARMGFAIGFTEPFYVDYIVMAAEYDQPPVTDKTLSGPVWGPVSGGISLTSATDIWFTATGGLMGTAELHVNVMWDSDDDGFVDTQKLDTVIMDNDLNDQDIPPDTDGVIRYGINLHDEGLHEIRYYSIDYFGNMEDENLEIDLVDETPPVTTKEYGSPFYVGATVSWTGTGAGDVNHYITSDTPIYLNTTDNCSGVNRTEYRVHRWDGASFVEVQPWTVYMGPFSFSSIGDTNECLHRIRIRSYDNLGNEESAWNQYVMVDNTPPVSTKVVGWPQYLFYIWQLSTVDSPGPGDDVGQWSSLALDSGNCPHISYYDDTNTALKYAYMDGSGWHTTTVDNTGDVGMYSSLALDTGGYPHISYYDATFTNTALKYAYMDGGGWHIFTVDSPLFFTDVGQYTSLALDSGNYPHISYYDVTNTALKYAYMDGGGWHTDTVDTGLLPGDDVGMWSSLALDSSGSPRISYYDVTNTALKYAYMDSGGVWHPATVDNTGNVGMYSSLALDSSDYPRISYYDVTNGALKYAYWDGSWQFDTVDTSVFFNVGMYSSLALDSSGYPKISYYYGWPNTALKYAYKDGSGWHNGTVDSPGFGFLDNVGQYTSLALDSDGYLHISYYDVTNGALKYAYNESLRWYVTTYTPIFLNTSDGSAPCAVGCEYLHYEVWWDSDGDGVVDTKVESGNASSNNVTFSFSETCYHEIWWYGVDFLGNTETVHVQGHFVDDAVPEINISVGDPLYGFNVTTGTPFWINISDDCSLSYARVTYQIDTDFDNTPDSTVNFGVFYDSDDGVVDGKICIPLNFPEECRHRWRVRAYDESGKDTGWVLSSWYRVDDTPPVTTKEIGRPLWFIIKDDWHTVTVDSPGDVGEFTSLALDNDGYPHISYYDATHGYLKYAYMDTGGWHIVTVDNTDHVGWFTSLALDSNGYPHISYYDVTHGFLKYAYMNASGWHINTVDNSPVNDVGWWTSLALDSNDYPHISYLDSTAGFLKYAYWNGVSWSFVNVDFSGNVGGYTSLALDSGDSPHISYYDSANDFLMYAYKHGGVWLTDIVDNSGIVGGYISLALDSGDSPHISYYEAGANFDLKYAYKDGSGWHSILVDSTGLVGWYTSLAVGMGGYPHISYCDVANGDLKYAYEDSGGWHIVTVDSPNDVGCWASLALDWHGYPHISYYNVSNNDLKYAYLDSGRWYFVTTGTPIWLNTSDGNSSCAVGCEYLHYEVWWDSDGDGVVDTRVDSGDASSNNVTIYFSETCYHEIWWYGVDLLGNTEFLHVQGHFVDDAVPVINISVGDPLYGFNVTTGTPFWINISDDCSLSYARVTYQIDTDFDNTPDSTVNFGVFYDGDDGVVDGKICLLLNFSEECRHRWRVRAYDELGRDTGWILSPWYRVDDTPPVTTKEIGRPLWFIIKDGWDTVTVDSPGDVGRYSSLALDSSGYPHISYYDVTHGALKYAYMDGGGWHTVMVDNTDDVGEYSSLALDSDGYPHISYYEATHGFLKYAYMDGGGWHIATVDNSGDVGGHTSLALDSNDYPHISYLDSPAGFLMYAYWDGVSWHFDTADSSGNVGGYTSLALDSGGSPHISYYDFFNSDLMYTYKHGGVWITSTVDGFGLTDVGWYTSLALDSNDYPHISYYDSSNSDLKYAYKDVSGWHIVPVDSTIDMVGWDTSLALGMGGYPHISYHDATHGDLKYAYEDSDGWHIVTVDSPDIVGWYTSLALDWHGYPHISYYNVSNNDLKYAYLDSGRWYFVTTGTPIWLNTSDGNSSCAVGCNYTHYEVWWDSDGDGVVDVLVESGDEYSNNVTIYFSETCYHEIWWYGVDLLGNTETVHVQGHFVDDAAPEINISVGDPLYGFNVTTGTPFWINVTDDCNLSHVRVTYQIDADCDGVVDSTETVGDFYDGDDGVVDGEIRLLLRFPEECCHRWRVRAYDECGRDTGWILNPWYRVDDTPPVTTKMIGRPLWFIIKDDWHTVTVDNTPPHDIGEYSSLALDNGGYPHISYYEATHGDLKYAYMDGGGWHTVIVDNTGDVGQYTSIALDSNGYPHISYYDATNGELQYAYMDSSGGWHIFLVDDGLGVNDVGLFTSLVLDSSDYPHISYLDSTAGFLMYAYWDGVIWIPTVADNSGDVGGYTSLALDSNGYPHISYYDSTNDDLMYAYKDGGGWHTGPPVDSTGNVGWYTSLALNSGDYPHISYFDIWNDALKYAYWDGSSWHTVTVDGTVGAVGWYTSLALGMGGYPHISYCDVANGDLKYAYEDSDGWHIVTVDSPNDVGCWASLALDWHGYPHISYYDTTNGGLKYAYLDSGRWYFVTTGTPIWLNTTDLGPYCAVGCNYTHYEVWWDSDNDGVVDTLMESGNASSNNVTLYFSETCYHEIWWYGVDFLGNTEFLHVQGHFVDDAAPEINISVGDPQYGFNVTMDTPFWINVTDDCNLSHVRVTYQIDADCDGVVDSTETVGIFYDTDDDNVISLELRFPEECCHRWRVRAYDESGKDTGWVLGSWYHVDNTPPETTKEIGVPLVITGGDWHLDTVDNAGDVGLYTSLAVDNSGYPHISYHDSGNNDLRYAYWDGTVWNIFTVDSTNIVGQHTSLALNSSGYPHISYYDTTNTALKYAYMDSGGVWHLGTIDNTADVGGYTSIALDSSDYPHISYYDFTNGDLKYAYKDGGGWHTGTVVDSIGNVGVYTSLAFDSSGYPHISYYDWGNGDLKYAYMDSGGWHTDWVDNTGDVGRYTSLALDSSDYPHISYYDVTNGDLRYAYQNGGGWWHLRTIDNTGIVGGFTSLALDSSSYPHISYTDDTNTALKYAYKDGGGWHTVTVDNTGIVGGYTSLALDSSDCPHISYNDGTNTALKYAYQDIYRLFVTTDTPIWLNTTDSGPYCAVGCNYTHYEVWWDSDGDGVVDMLVESGNASSNNVTLYFSETCYHEIWWYGVDLLGNTEAMHFKGLYVDDAAPEITVEMGDPHYGTNVTTGTPFWINVTDDCTLSYVRVRYEIDVDCDGVVDSTKNVGVFYDTDDDGVICLLLNFSEECCHRWRVRAYDESGKDTGWVFSSWYRVDDTPPVTTKEIGDPLVITEGDWHLDTLGFNAKTPSLTLDSNGYPHISYLEPTPANDDLKYVYRDGSGWHIVTVDNAGINGHFPSLALDNNGYPHISYYYGDPNNDLKYAYRDGGGWHIVTVDSTGDVGWWSSLALDSSGYPHISYYDYTNGDLKYAYQDAGGWHLGTVDSTGDVGWWSSLALDSSGYPHISYFDQTNGDLKYAYKDAGGWNLGTIDSAGVVGSYTSLALDSSNYPHISYFDGTNIVLKYAYKDGGGWHLGTVDSGGVGYYTSLALDSGDYPHISYYDAGPDDLKYAYRDGGGWHIVTVDNAPDTGLDTSLALDSNGCPHISYIDDDLGLKYVYKERGHLYVTTGTSIWLNTTDETTPCAVGCQYLHYEVWWDSDNDGVVDTLMESGNASSNNVTIYFTEGCYHEIWWYGVDHLGNTETMHAQGHYVDDIAPVTTYEFGVPYYTDGIDEYINASTIIYLNATDIGPCQIGDYAISFRVWDMVSGWGPWVPGTPSTNMTHTVSEEGRHYIEFYAVDYLGNEAPLQNISFYADVTPPTTTKEYGLPFYVGDTVSWPTGGDVNHYITSDTLIYLNATDNCLGINRTEYRVYRWNGASFDVIQPWTVYTDPFNFSSIGDNNECLHRIRIRSYDTLGNAESAWNQYVMVDNTPPETTKEIGRPRRSGGLYVTTDTPIWLNTTDTGTTRCKAGCNYTHYEIWWDSDGDHVVDMLMESGNASSNNVTIYFTETCYHEIWWYGVDFLGNTETMHVQGHYVDDTAPEIAMQVGYPRYDDGGYVYVTTSTPFWINVTDDCNLSYARVWYQYDTNCDGIYANEYLGYFYDTDDDDVISLQLNFPQNGCHRWRAQAFDMYGRETGNWYSDWYRVIDTTPKINIMGTSNQVGHEGIPVTFTAGTVTANITFTAGATTVTIPITGPELDENLTYYWDWNNDGIYDEGPLTTNTVNHTWPDDYTENVNVQVRYKYGGMDNDTCIITILNIPPTAPTDIIIDPPFFSLGDILEATAIGSTDVPADIPLTYWYLFYDATTDSLIQDWSTLNSIVITASLENHIILVKSRAHDKDSGISDVTQVTATSGSGGVTPTISINPVISTVIQGNDFCIEIHIDSAGHSILTTGFQLTYPTIFTIKSFTYENLLGTSIIELGTPPVGDTSGLINYAVSRTDGDADPENGTLVTICFTAPSSPGGPYTLDLHDIILVDGTGTTISGIVVTDGTVTVNSPSQCPCRKGDIDKDCYIGPIDLTFFATAWGKSPGQTGYNECFDMDDSGGAIDAIDLSIFASHWGETYCDCAPCNAPPWQQWP